MISLLSLSKAVHVASAINQLLHGRNVLGLGTNERPDFIALDALGSHVPSFAAMQISAEFAGIDKQLGIVLIDASATREIDLIELPSLSIERI